MSRRLVQLVAGVALYGISLGLVLRAGLGLAPWDVFHQGLAELTGLGVGQVIIAVSFALLLAWIPLRERLGFGTLVNSILVGVFVELTLQVLGAVDAVPVRIALLCSGILLNTVATALYLGAALGSGARDGLMNGMVRRTGQSVRLVRTSIEIAVLASGWLLGGTVGVGTLLYAFAIGPIVQVLLVPLRVRVPSDPGGRA